MIDPHFQKLFALGLNIEEPWLITSIEMVPVERNPSLMELHIKVDFAEGATFDYPGFEGKCKVHDTRENTWRHLNFFQYRCYITARVPRVITPDGKVKTVAVPWARSGSGFTLMMEGVILTLVKHMPVRTVAREIGEHDTKLWRLIDYHTEEALKDQDFSDVSAIGVDEYSHKGHNYITVFLSHPDVVTDEAGRRRQAGKGRVLFVTEGKDKDAVLRFLERFKAKDGTPEQVEVATSDMIHGFRSAMQESFPNAVVTVDKFHVLKNCSDAVDNTRRRELRSKDSVKARDLKESRYIWLKNPDNLTDKQRTRLSQLLEVEYLDTVQAYSCRLELQDFYETHKAYDEEMISAFEEMVIKFANSPVKEIRKFAACLTRNTVEILNYFQTLRTNAILEGFNSKISIIKSRARGFKNMRNFMNMIYFVCGELSLPLQPIM
ncbi:MAG: ISL3 family transposase [Spirochaetales bacterium]|jgi:transposase|nr:ISL3 family transposase [Spirochaetales bacterium]